ncbi:MAG: helix-turn-helix domain-containing protein [Hyphomicrobiales bacterium]|nr:helix-turn-helix domain-containing protein [Hyphomicrobiales bacterium]
MRDQKSVNGMQRAELAKRTGCNLETVRYYEKAGLLPEPPRTARGYRSYDSAHERRLRFVLRARELGFSLDEVRALLRLADERDQPCAEASRLASVHLAGVQAKIADLRRMESVLQTTIAQCGDGARPDCPLIETLFREDDSRRKRGDPATRSKFIHR